MGILDVFDSPSFLQGVFGLSADDPMAQSIMGGGRNGGIGSDAGQAPNAPQPAGNMPMPQADPRGYPQGAQSVDEAGMSQAPQLAPGIPMPQARPADLGPQGAPSVDEAGFTGGGKSDSANPNFAQRFAPAEPGMPTYILPTNSGGGGAMAQAAPTEVSSANRGGSAVPLPPPGGQLAPSGGVAGQPAPNAGLAGAFGLKPEQQKAREQGQAIRSALSGFGRGLSAVGRLQPGATAGQAVGAGMGGALEGSTAMQQHQEENNFKELSTAFDKVQAARNSDDNSKYKAAQTQYALSRAKNLEAMTKAGKLSGAYQNSPEYKVLRVEQMAEAHRANELKALREQFKGDADGFGKAKAELTKEVEQYKAGLYKRSGIDPNNAEKIMNMGTAADNPFDARTMTKDEFEARVPKGGFFINKDGKVYRRKSERPYDPRSGAPQNTASAATTQDDQDILTDAA